MSLPLISIIVPVYKVPEEYLRKCIESCMVQTLQEIEIIIVDDGSPDNCGLICDEYANFEKRIKVIHKENNGVSSARNCGIDSAKGQYIMFVDSDDWIEPQTVELALKWMNESNSDLVGWNHYYTYDIKEEERKAISPNPVIFEKEKIYDLTLDMVIPEYDERYHNISLGAIRGVWGKLFKTDIIKNNNIKFSSDLKIGEDTCFNIDYIRHISKGVFYNEYLYHYRVFDESENRRYRSDIASIRINMLKAYLERFDENVITFGTTYVRAVLSCVVNCMSKFFCHTLNTASIKKKIGGISEVLNSREVRIVSELNFDKNFFTTKEKVLLFLIQHKLSVFLYILGNLICRG